MFIVDLSFIVDLLCLYYSSVGCTYFFLGSRYKKLALLIHKWEGRDTSELLGLMIWHFTKKKMFLGHFCCCFKYLILACLCGSNYEVG